MDRASRPGAARSRSVRPQPPRGYRRAFSRSSSPSACSKRFPRTKGPVSLTALCAGHPHAAEQDPSLSGEPRPHGSPGKGCQGPAPMSWGPPCGASGCWPSCSTTRSPRPQQQLHLLREATGFTFLLYMWTDQGATLIGLAAGGSSPAHNLSAGFGHSPWPAPPSAGSSSRNWRPRSPNPCWRASVSRPSRTGSNRRRRPRSTPRCRPSGRPGCRATLVGFSPGWTRSPYPSWTQGGDLVCVIAAIVQRRFLDPATRKRLEARLRTAAADLSIGVSGA